MVTSCLAGCRSSVGELRHHHSQIRTTGLPAYGDLRSTAAGPPVHEPAHGHVIFRTTEADAYAFAKHVLDQKKFAGNRIIAGDFNEWTTA